MIDKPYAYHKPSAEGLAKINRLREHFSNGERLIKEICPLPTGIRSDHRERDHSDVGIKAVYSTIPIQR
jgi:hypothetical protein